METNQFFSLKRFYQLLRNDVLINYKTYLLTFIGAFFLGFAIFYMDMPKHNVGYVYNHINYMRIVIISLFGLGVFVGLSFPEMSNKIRATNYLLLPASTFEKYLVQFLIRFIGGIILFILIIWLDTHLARWTILNFYKELDPLTIQKLTFQNMINGEKTHIMLAMIFAILSLGSYLFSVRLFFKKNALVKTVISFGIVVYILFCLTVMFSHLFYPETNGFNVNLKEYELTNLHVRNVEFWLYSIMYLSGLFLLPLGYFKLKEKQV